jgi:hypothetical protein
LIGTYGAGSGSVYVFQQYDEAYTEVAKIVGNDTNENDQFGCSVDLSGVNLLVLRLTFSDSGLEQDSG